VEESEKHNAVSFFTEHAKFDGAKINCIDGIRVEFPWGWGLIRASNTTPALILRFEADTHDNLDLIKNKFREQLMAIRSLAYLASRF